MEWTVAIGVDTHRDLHVAVALDRLGRRLGSLEFEVSEEGFAELRRFACRLGRPAFVVEGTGSYGASLARELLAKSLLVYECERPQRRGRAGKNDLLDAERAAGRLLACERLALPRTGAARERLRLLLAERRSCQRARTQARNQLQAAIVSLDPALRSQLARLREEALSRSLAARRRPELAALRRLAKRSEPAQLGAAHDRACPHPQSPRDAALLRPVAEAWQDEARSNPLAQADARSPSLSNTDSREPACARLTDIEASQGWGKNPFPLRSTIARPRKPLCADLAPKAAGPR